MYEELDHRFQIGSGIASLIISPFVILGNAMVIISIIKFKRLRTTTNMFIGSLAFSDLSLGLITLPLYALFYFEKSMIGMKYLCLFKYSSVLFSLSSSLVNLVVIAVDRYIAVLHPLQYRIWMTRKRAKLIIGSVWTYHVIICAIPSLGWNLYDKHGKRICDFFTILPKPYSMFTCPITILVGLIISLILYIQIFKVAQRATNKKKKRNHQFSKDTKSAKVMGLILFFFFIFWIPFMIAAASKYMNYDPNLSNIIKNFTLLLAMSNSAINPVIYCWLRIDFRKAFKEVVKGLPYFCNGHRNADHLNISSSLSWSSSSVLNARSQQQRINKNYNGSSSHIQENFRNGSSTHSKVKCDIGSSKHCQVNYNIDSPKYSQVKCNINSPTNSQINCSNGLLKHGQVNCNIDSAKHCLENSPQKSRIVCNIDFPTNSLENCKIGHPLHCGDECKINSLVLCRRM